MKKNKDCSNMSNLVQTINDSPDMLHIDYTPSVHLLCGCGLEAIKGIVPLLNSENNLERLRAQRVLEGVINRKYGWKGGVGFPHGSEDEEKVKILMEENGNYQYNASIENRSASIEKWEQWLVKNLK